MYSIMSWERGSLCFTTSGRYLVSVHSGMKDTDSTPFLENTALASSERAGACGPVPAPASVTRYSSLMPEDSMNAVDLAMRLAARSRYSAGVCGGSGSELPAASFSFMSAE